MRKERPKKSALLCEPNVRFRVCICVFDSLDFRGCDFLLVVSRRRNEGGRRHMKGKRALVTNSVFCFIYFLRVTFLDEGPYKGSIGLQI